MTTKSEPTSVDSLGSDRQTGKTVYARMAAGLALSIMLTAVILFVAGHSGGTLREPVGALPWQLAVIAIALAILVGGAVQSVRLGKLNRMFLIGVAAGTAFWQETYGDWGSYLLYSPGFVTYDWQNTMWASPVRCWWFIPGYVFFYTAFLLALEKAFYAVKDRWPNSNPYLATAVVSFPAFYVFDMALEGAAHGFGWWQYQYAFGPSVAIGAGHFPLLWPILEQVPFMVLAVFAMTWRNADGEDVFELLARKVIRRKPGQAAILVSWILSVNAAFLVTTILPLMAMRAIAGPAIASVP